ncbi:hypothetical protein SAMN05444411_1219 [Lutibacter oricola]|uniref:Uncharacterized protein n=1 Tax=Lutibacter oricola TaxID=762486 RepID=A0A1H3GZB1_9FLAO|nr:hypothetical protein [Lutibacter oricola]SDY08663.1 hypothetical protein SAMN05444411_1219 [Lutibacter oricola]
MKIKDFFKLIIKLIGLYLTVQTVFSYIPTNLSYVISSFEYGDFFKMTLITLIYSVIVVLIFLFVLFRADRIVDFLRLDKGFDNEKIEFGDFNNQNIMKLALILIGGIMIVSNLSEFLNFLFHAFKTSAEVSMFGNDGLTGEYYFNWVVSGLNILIGYLLMTNFKSISKWLIK